MPPVNKSTIEEIPVRLEELRRMDVLVHIGKLVAAGLTANGIVVLHLHPSGEVCIADPTKVYLDVGALVLDEGALSTPKYRWLRPIVGVDKPTHVAWRNGELWEVELTEPESRETKNAEGNEDPAEEGG